MFYSKSLLILFTYILIFSALASKCLGATLSTPLTSSEVCKCLPTTDPCEEPNPSIYFDPINVTSRCQFGFVLCCFEVVTDEAIHSVSDDTTRLGKKIKRHLSEDFDYYADDDVIENADKIFEGFITFVNTSSSPSSKDASTEELFSVYDDYYTDYDDVSDDADHKFENPASISEVVADDEKKQSNRDNDDLAKTTEKSLGDSAPSVNSSSVSEDLTNEHIEGYGDYYADDDVIENADKIIEGFIIFKNSTLPPTKVVADEEPHPLYNNYSEVYDVTKVPEKFPEESETLEISSPVPNDVNGKLHTGYKDYYSNDDVVANADKIFEGLIVFKNMSSDPKNVDEKQPPLHNEYYLEDLTRDKSNANSDLSETFKNSSFAPEHTNIEEQPLMHNDSVPINSDKNFDGLETFVNSGSLAHDELVDKPPILVHNFYYTDDDVIENADKIIQGYIIIKNTTTSTPTNMGSEGLPLVYKDYYIDYDYSLQNSSVPDNDFPESSQETRTNSDSSSTPKIKAQFTFVQEELTSKQKLSRAITHYVSNDSVSTNYHLNQSIKTINNSNQLPHKYENYSTIVENSPNELIVDKATPETLLTNNYLPLMEENINEGENSSNTNNFTEVAKSNIPLADDHSHFKTGLSVSSIFLYTDKKVEQEMSTPNPSFDYTIFNYGDINDELLPEDNCSSGVGNCLNNNPNFTTTNNYDSVTQIEEKQKFKISNVTVPTKANDSFMQRFLNNFFISSSFETVEASLENENYSLLNKSFIQGNNSIVNQSYSNLNYKPEVPIIDDNDGVTPLNESGSPLTHINLPFPDATNQNTDVGSTAHFNPKHPQDYDAVNTSMIAVRRSQISEYESTGTKSNFLDRSVEDVPRTLPPIHIRSPLNFTFPVNEEELSTPKPRQITTLLDWFLGRF